MKSPDSSLISLKISNQIFWFPNNTLQHFVFKVRLKITKCETKSTNSLNFHAYLKYFKWKQQILFPDYKPYFQKKLVKVPNKPLSLTALAVFTVYYTISFSLNFLIKEDVKHERFQSKLLIKIESFLHL